MKIINDYYPFGMLLPNRHGSSDKYRYGYQGSEKDDELKGEGNSYTTYLRAYEPRIAGWHSIDPEIAKYPEWSPYVVSFNNPIVFKDSNGDDPITAIAKALFAFALDEGLGFLTNPLLEDESAGDVIKNVNWGYEGVKTYFISSIFTGAGSVKKINKFRKSALGRVTINSSKNFVEEVVKDVLLGKYGEAFKLSEYI